MLHFNVTNLDDSGPGSLRAAIESSNESTTRDTIYFLVIGTITVLSELPHVSTSVVINGNGSTIQGDPEFDGIVFDSVEGSIVRELTLLDFRIGISSIGGTGNFAVDTIITNSLYYGIYAEDSFDVTLRRNIIHNSDVIGFMIRDSEECTIQGNVVTSSGLDGIRLIESDLATIGGPDEWMRNFVKLNGLYGILLSESNYATVQGNTITENVRTGLLSSMSSHGIFETNVIFDNQRNGINIDGTIGVGGVDTGLGRNNHVFANTITGNGLSGVLIFQGQNNTVAANTIAENLYGIQINFPESSRNLAIGNVISDSVESGVRINGGVDNRIGSHSQPNTISGNPIGIDTTEGNQVLQNTMVNNVVDYEFN